MSWWSLGIFPRLMKIGGPHSGSSHLAMIGLPLLVVASSNFFLRIFHVRQRLARWSTCFVTSMILDILTHLLLLVHIIAHFFGVDICWHTKSSHDSWSSATARHACSSNFFSSRWTLGTAWHLVLFEVWKNLWFLQLATHTNSIKYPLVI